MYYKEIRGAGDPRWLYYDDNGVTFYKTNGNVIWWINMYINFLYKLYIFINI